MKPRRTISAYILLVGILGLSVVGGVVIYGIYSSLVKTQITPGQATLIRPLDGEIDTELLDSLQTRRKFSTTELSVEVTPTPSPTPTPTEAPVEVITPGAPAEASPGAINI